LSREEKTLRRYETVIIVPADFPDDEINGLSDRYKGIITNHKGLVMKIEKWGKRKLAYEIKKHNRGFYMLIDFAGQSAVVAELERNLKIDDRILKFMTVKKDDQVVLEDLQKELAAASPAPAAAEAEAVVAEPPAVNESNALQPAPTEAEETREGGE
jgi:small subunit ribosomal protein S6